jgi:hypothetical protein
MVAATDEHATRADARPPARRYRLANAQQIDFDQMSEAARHGETFAGIARPLPGH